MPLLPYLSAPIVQQLAGVGIRGVIQTGGIYYLGRKMFKRTVSGAAKYTPRPAGLIRRTGIKGKGSLAKRVKNLEVNFPRPALRVHQLSGNVTIGQTNVDGQASLGLLISPAPPLGTGVGNRQGDEIFIKSMYITLQMKSLYSATGVYNQDRKLRVEIFRVPDAGYNDVAKLYLNNGVTGTVDYYSARNNEFAEHYTTLFDKTFMLTGPGNSHTEGSHDICIPLRFKQPLKMDFDSGGLVVSMGAILIIMRPSWGNQGATISTKNIPVKTPLTGIDVVLNSTAWYTS